MKLAVIAVYAVFASNMGYEIKAKPVSYNDWIAVNSKVATGQRPTAQGVDGFINWSKNYAAQ